MKLKPNPTVTFLLIAALMLLALSATAVARGSDPALPVPGQKMIIDQSGRKVSVGKPFKRIISLYGAHTENLFALGLNSEIIGVSTSEAFPEEATRKPAFSYHDDPEVFLAARPDLVLIRPMIDRGYPKLIARLEKSGITVVSLQPSTVKEMYRYWQTLGLLSDTRKQAMAMIASFERAVEQFHALTRTLSTKKRVYFEAIHNRMKTFAPDAMAIFALETAGGLNIAKDAQPVRGTNIAAYGKERILALAEQMDVYMAQTGNMNRPTLAMIKNEPGYGVIKAIRTDQVFIIDEMIVSRPTFRLLDGIFAIGQVLYPQLFDEKALKILEAANDFRNAANPDLTQAK